MTNLYQEMIEKFTPYKITYRAICYVVNSIGTIPIAEFIQQAQSCNYEKEKDKIKIDPTLCVVGRSWWISRTVVDGIEQWEMHKKPVESPIKVKDVILLNKGGN